MGTGRNGQPDSLSELGKRLGGSFGNLRQFIFALLWLLVIGGQYFSGWYKSPGVQDLPLPASVSPGFLAAHDGVLAGAGYVAAKSGWRLYLVDSRGKSIGGSPLLAEPVRMAYALDQLYVELKDNSLCCFDLAGQQLWRQADTDLLLDNYGNMGAQVNAGRLVVRKGQYICALDKAGVMLWQYAMPYENATAITHPDSPRIFAVGSGIVRVISAEGEALASLQYSPGSGVQVCTPTGELYCMEEGLEYDDAARLVRITAEGVVEPFVSLPEQDMLYRSFSMLDCGLLDYKGELLLGGSAGLYRIDDAGNCRRIFRKPVTRVSTLDDGRIAVCTDTYPYRMFPNGMLRFWEGSQLRILDEAGRQQHSWYLGSMFAFGILDTGGDGVVINSYRDSAFIPMS
ncbi:MAG: hypothetical protein H7A35_03995 [Planctomycetales bacterium]|nr:hypothetical protein [bacterium]UNM09218.1 MAG: hypothetical protein H7A35_03995 [Planctomycetales bacterium]